MHDGYNDDLLRLIPRNAARIVEVGCSGGALARAYLGENPGCEYIGIEKESEYAQAARGSCSKVIVGDIERMNDGDFAGLFPSECWIFGDVIEHLYDPWTVLGRIRRFLAPEASVIACIPNAQHWSVQTRLVSGALRYEESGLLDFTHIRWFTKATIADLFRSSGYRITEGGGRIFDEPARERALTGIRALARAIGVDVEEAVNNAIPLQWVVRAVPDASAVQTGAFTRQ